MIKIENVVTPSDEQWEAVVRGVRNPYASWEKSDGTWNQTWVWLDEDHQVVKKEEYYSVGDDNLKLMMKLSHAGDDHGKFLRMLPVICDITAPLTWWKQMSQYKIGTVTNSTSTMHCIQREEFSLDMFDTANIDDETMPIMMDVVKELNRCRTMYNTTKDKRYWNSMINLLPESYHQKRTWSGNYQTLKHIYHARKNHRLRDWETFCAFIITLPLAEQLIVGAEEE